MHVFFHHFHFSSFSFFCHFHHFSSFSIFSVIFIIFRFLSFFAIFIFGFCHFCFSSFFGVSVFDPKVGPKTFESNIQRFKCFWASPIQPNTPISHKLREVWAHVGEQVVRATRGTTTQDGTIHAWLVGKTLLLARYRRLSRNAL